MFTPFAAHLIPLCPFTITFLELHISFFNLTHTYRSQATPQNSLPLISLSYKLSWSSDRSGAHSSHSKQLSKNIVRRNFKVSQFSLSLSRADPQSISLLSLLFPCLYWIEADVVFLLLTSYRYHSCKTITMSSPPEYRRPHDPATSERQQRSALAIFGIDESAFETQSDAGLPRGK